MALLLSTSAVAQSTVSARPIDAIAWMSGCWELTTPSRVVEEMWMKARGGTMLGMGRTIVRDSLTEFESTLIRAKDETLFYEAHPSGQPSATFPSIAISADSVVFELPEHDFPQRVGYTRIGTDSLVAWIEGTRNGRSRRLPFPYRRVACPGR